MSLSILIVDDEPLIRVVARDILEGVGFRVSEAGSVVAALEVLSEATIDVVLTDIELGSGPSGLELARKIRSDWPNVDLVIMSGRLLPTAGELLDAEFVTKPFSDERLLSVMRSCARRDK